jgi:hypothetical protein
LVTAHASATSTCGSAPSVAQRWILGVRCIWDIDGDRRAAGKLHRHPYKEVFIVQEGSVTFTAGDDIIEASGGQVVVWCLPASRTSSSTPATEPFGR